MNVQKTNSANGILFITIVIVAALRIAALYAGSALPEWMNFTPIGAMALYGGAYFNSRVKSFAFPLLALFISDVILSYTIYAPYRTGLLYAGWYWTYAAFALMVIVGKLLLNHITAYRIITAVIATTIIHWLVSDIGGCVVNGAPSLQIYGQRLITAIPYELRFLAGTAFYSALMFGSFEWMKVKKPELLSA